MKYLKPLVIISLLFALLGAGFVQAQQSPDCGVLVEDGGPEQFISGLGAVSQFELGDVPAGSLLLLEVNTFEGDEVVANLVLADDGKTIYMSNSDNRTSSTIVLSTFFAEAVAGVSGEIVWNSAPKLEHTYTLTLDCPSATAGEDIQATSSLESRLPDVTPLVEPNSRAFGTLQVEDGLGEGVAYAPYNRSIEITAQGENGESFKIAFTPPTDLPRVTGRESLLLAGSTQYGYAVYTLPNGSFLVNVGPDDANLMTVTVFDGLPAKRIRHYTVDLSNSE